MISEKKSPNTSNRDPLVRDLSSSKSPGLFPRVHTFDLLLVLLDSFGSLFPYQSLN